MSFSFSFSGDDIEVDENDPSGSLATKLGHTSLDASSSTQTLLPPKRHTLAELLQSLPSQISYNWLEVLPSIVAQRQDSAEKAFPEGHANGRTRREARARARVPRRALFDIRQQLMHEADPVAGAEGDDVEGQAANDQSEDKGDATANLLAGLETGDLTSGIYEGGFKTWECAVDLASFVLDHHKTAVGESNIEPEHEQEQEQHVIELGAGSAIPSLVLLQKVLGQRQGRQGHLNLSKLRFTLCDYNEDVLRLCTAVNVFLTTTLCLQSGPDTNTTEADEQKIEEADIEIDEALINQTLQTLERANIQIDFISGAWGAEFVKLLREPASMPDTNSVMASNTSSNRNSTNVLILASETIYSPTSLSVFSQTILDLQDQSIVTTMINSKAQPKTPAQSNSTATSTVEALVAAKKVYFGVGGGVAEFKNEVEKRGGRVETVLDVQGAGVGRVVLAVSRT